MLHVPFKLYKANEKEHIHYVVGTGYGSEIQLKVEYKYHASKEQCIAFGCASGLA